MNNSSSGRYSCSHSLKLTYIFTPWFSLYFLMLPLFLFVLYIGFNKWKKSKSSSSALNHSDVFTLHMASMETVGVIGSCFSCYGFWQHESDVLEMGTNVVMVTTTVGQMLFHSLTCVERYIAVVHPVIYISLRNGSGVLVRNVGVGAVWTFSGIYIIFSTISSITNVINRGHFQAMGGLMASFLPTPVVIYCSLSVLCVLFRPKPGESGGDRWQIDRSKRTTVYTMLLILGALLLRLVVQLIMYGLFIGFMGNIDGCLLSLVSLWAALPSCLVLPLLFLHRAGKLPHQCRG